MYIEYTPIDLFDEAEQHLQYPPEATTTIGFGYSVGGSGSGSGIGIGGINNTNTNHKNNFNFNLDNGYGYSYGGIDKHVEDNYAFDDVYEDDEDNLGFDFDCEKLHIVQNGNGFFELKKNQSGRSRPTTTTTASSSFKRKCNVVEFPSKNYQKLKHLKTTINRREYFDGDSQTNINGTSSSGIPMGFDIIAKLRKLFGESSSDGASSRKRRADDSNWNSTSTQFKYRRVDNEFPKIVKKSFEEDEIKIVPQRLHKTPLGMAQQNQKDKRSQFIRPKTVNKQFTNTNFADIEFSDDEDAAEIFFPSSRAGPSFNFVPSQTIIGRQGLSRANVMPSTSSMKMTNIPFKQSKLPPPLIQASTGDILPSTIMPDLQPIRQYSSILSACTNGYDQATSYHAQNQNHHRPTGTTGVPKNSTTMRTKTASPFLFNGNYLNVNSYASSKGAARSIIAQENQSKDQKHYRELLQKVMPTLYGIGINKNDSSPKIAPLTSKNRLSINRTKEQQPVKITTPITRSATTAAERSNVMRNRKSSTGEVIATFELSDDDDEVSEFIDLADDELNMLSACSKLQEDQAECSYDVKRRAAEKKKQLPFVEPVNSLKEKFDLSPVCQGDWLDKFHKKWNMKHLEGKIKIAETEKEVELASAETRDMEKEMQMRLRELQIVDPDLIVIDDFPEEEEEPEFPVLTPEHEAIIKNAVFGGSADQMLISKFNMSITRRDIGTLLGKTWLNDEVINFYMNLLTERGELRASEGLPKVYAMNTFFVPRLLQSGHSGVRRWTRKIDIFTYDILPVPVHVGGVHWCMAIIHLRDRSIKYYDSMGTPNPKILSALEQYLREESLDKRKRPFDTSGFLIESVRDVPQQNNGSDCGVFSCMFAEFITRDREITFSQSNMDYFRHKMILEIVQGKLMQ